MRATLEGAKVVADLRRAAKSVEEEQWCSCCNAIAFSTTSQRRSALMQRMFTTYFKPDDAGIFWWNGCACGVPSTRGPRVLALCFMAAMVEAGDA